MPEVEAHMGPLAHYEVHLDAELLHVMIVEARLAGEHMGRSEHSIRRHLACNLCERQNVYSCDLLLLSRLKPTPLGSKHSHETSLPSKATPNVSICSPSPRNATRKLLDSEKKNNAKVPIRSIQSKRKRIESKKRPSHAAASKARSSIICPPGRLYHATHDVRMYADHWRIVLLVERFEELGHV